ncbi:uncharacterized protein LOC100836560 [Brachypodium distachyon]|uniref:Uncharacterized protein n=1 Tax=Brachypodium distachyon TaxID=15368 RepID=A0A0Q3MB85_BRADI|nr:uncharacterized protein LOC100836560 [Brachypodium distachyon]KQK01582.1 hypothetical protein BRADI_3g56835v3 [Brachypodium distachyon]|eukprot:XP_010236023.1 uncharacterized protein LOC100836560 [Brachypodium distachyon]
MENSWDEEERVVAAARAVVVHSQVRRIKQEEGEKGKVHETFQHQAAAASSSGTRLPLRDLAASGNQPRSRSPLGRRPPAISIGGDS